MRDALGSGCFGLHESTAFRPPCGPVVPTSPPHRAPGRAACHPGAHSVRHRCAADKAQERNVKSAALRGLFKVANVAVRLNPHVFRASVIRFSRQSLKR